MSMEKNSVIIVSDSSDQSTNKVMAYISFLGYQSIRITPDYSYRLYSTDEYLSLINEASSIWLRRGNLPFIKTFHHRLLQELRTLKYYLYFLMEGTSRCLGSLVNEYDHNKLIDLEKAKEVGLLSLIHI